MNIFRINNTTYRKIFYKSWAVKVIFLSMVIISCGSCSIDVPAITPTIEYHIVDMGKAKGSGDTRFAIGGSHDNSIGLNDIIESSDGHIIVTGYKGSLQEYDRKGGLIRIYNAPHIGIFDHVDSPSLGRTIINLIKPAFLEAAAYDYQVFDGSNAVIETKDGNIIVAGVSGGLQEFNRQGSLIKQTEIKDGTIIAKFIRDIIETRDGNIMIASNGGLREYDRQSNLVRNYPGLYEASAVIETKNGNIIGAGSMRRMYEFDRQGNILRRFNTNTAVLTHISGIIEAIDGNIIVASESARVHEYGVLEEYDKKGNLVCKYKTPYLVDAHAIIETKDGNVIVAGKGKLREYRKGEPRYYSISEYDRKGKLVRNYLAPDLYVARSVIETKDGSVIVAGLKLIQEKDGLYRVPCMYEFARKKSKGVTD